jgi:methionyl aminopeptidase
VIQIKSEREIGLMRQAGQILAETRRMLEPFIRPGITTGELERRAEQSIRERGGTPSFKGYQGYPKSICTSINEVVVHGIPSNRRTLKSGDILSLDIGVTYKGYHADSAMTYPVGRVEPAIKRLLDVALESLYQGLEMAKPGNHVSDISHAIASFIEPYGYGVVEEFTGHGIGRELHEDPYVPNFGPPHQGPLLKPGMTLCIEPMVNLGTKEVDILTDNWTTVTLDRKPSAHYEHMIVITETGYEILTALKKE